MRANGVDEKFITGKETSDWEKFEKWAETVPYTLRNPLYHWTHLELKTAFGIKRIYEKCNELLATPEYSARGLMKRYNVESVCTTDDPIDTLEYHKAIADSGFEVKVLPTWRPDKAMNVTTAAEYRAYLEKLSSILPIMDVSLPIMVLRIYLRLIIPWQKYRQYSTKYMEVTS